MGRMDVNDFEDALQQLTGGKRIVGRYLGPNGEYEIFTDKEEFHNFVSKEKGMTPEVRRPEKDPWISKTPNPTRPINKLPEAKLLSKEGKLAKAFKGAKVLGKAVEIAAIAQTTFNVVRDLARGDLDDAQVEVLDLFTFGFFSYGTEKTGEAINGIAGGLKAAEQIRTFDYNNPSGAPPPHETEQERMERHFKAQNDRSNYWIP